MERIRLSYYSYKPRMRVSVCVEMTVPVVGDIIHIPKEWITEVNKERKEFLCYYGLRFRVIERKAYFYNDYNLEWRIKLELIEE